MINNKGHSNFSMSNQLSPSVENMMARECAASIPVYNSLKVIADRLDVCQPTNTAIADKTNYSTRTVSRALHYMAHKGIIRIVKANHSRYIILNTLMFFHYVSADITHGIARRLKFNTPAEICRKDNPAFFKEYNKFLARNRAKRKSSNMDSRLVIRTYAKRHHTLPKHRELSDKQITLMKSYLIMCVKSLSRSKLYRKVGIYLVDKLPMYKGKIVNVTNNDISNDLRDVVGKTTVFKAISYFNRAKFLLHMRGKMAISPSLLSNAKRSMISKINNPAKTKEKILKIKQLKQELQIARAQNKQNKKQLLNRH